MDDAIASPEAAPKPALGIGDILNQTVSILRRRPATFVALAFFPYFILQLGFVFIAGVSPTGAAPPHWALPPSQVLGRGLIAIVAFWSLIFVVQAVIARAAITFHLGEGLRLSTAFMAAAASILPLVILSLLTSIFAVLGGVFLIVPGLFLMAVFYVLMPAIVFEDAGWSGMTRSVVLTRGYRWSIVALVLVVAIACGAVIFGLLMLYEFGAPLLGLYAGVQNHETDALLLLLFVDSLTSGLTYPIAMVAIAVTYVRLREIEGGGVSDALLEVFE